MPTTQPTYIEVAVRYYIVSPSTGTTSVIRLDNVRPDKPITPDLLRAGMGHAVQTFNNLAGVNDGRGMTDEEIETYKILQQAYEERPDAESPPPEVIAAIDAIRPHVEPWINLLSEYVNSLPPDTQPTAESEGSSAHSYAEHELRAAKRDLPALLAVGPLSQRDSEKLVRALLDPPEPNELLKAAAERYREWTEHDDESDREAYQRFMEKTDGIYTMRDFDIDAFADGVIAHREGKEFHECTHDRYTLKGVSWRAGWNGRALTKL